MDNILGVWVKCFCGLYILALAVCFIATIFNTVNWYKKRNYDNFWKESFFDAVILNGFVMIPVVIHLVCFIFYLAYLLGNYLLN